ncbi:MAG: imidazolonepropionase [Parvularculaceae bacterium]|nr:imidazolonepropionase [Parvularculaceae bacterium]
MPADQSSFVLRNASVATMRPGGTAYGLMGRGAVAVEAGRIAWVGADLDLPQTHKDLPSIDLERRLVTPALIDCHTHLVHGGERSREYEMRLQGATYQEIANAGGGILSTVRATREASDDELFAQALARLKRMQEQGVAVVEIKSGYGLTVEDELRQLRVARRLADETPVKVLTTWLAAHTLPPDFKGRPDAYLDEVVLPGMAIGAREGLIDAVDGFCETIAFTAEQIQHVFNAAKALGLPIKLHAEQLSNQGGAVTAARSGALSVDHLEYLDPADAPILAAAGTTAVLLPGAFYTLRESRRPPIDALREAGVPMAVATDYNPGTSPLTSLSLAMNMACNLFRLTPEEALAGTTRQAAKALGINQDYGLIEVGYRASLAVWDAEHPAALSYRIDGPALYRLFTEGENLT